MSQLSLPRFSLIKLRVLVLVVYVLLLVVPNVEAAAPASGAVLSIPAIHVHTSVTQAPFRGHTWDVSSLNMNVAHLEYTAWMGESSNIVLAGHSERVDGSPEIFYALDRMAVGDEVVLNENGVEHRYVVTEARLVDFTDISVIYPSDNERITFITCAIGTYDASINEYRQRLVVVAERVP